MMIGGTSARVTLQGPGTGMGGVESGSWMALFRAVESSAPRFVGTAVSTNLFSDHEGELFHLNCTLRLSSTMTRLDLNRNARAHRAETWLTKALWAGKSSANATASVRGQQGEPASVLFARILGSPKQHFGDVSSQSAAWSPIASRCAFGSCVGVFRFVKVPPPTASKLANRCRRHYPQPKTYIEL